MNSSINCWYRVVQNIGPLAAVVSKKVSNISQGYSDATHSRRSEIFNDDFVGNLLLRGNNSEHRSSNTRTITDAYFNSLSSIARLFATTWTTRSIGTVHTSANARFTSVAIRIQTRIHDSDRDEKFNQIVLWSFGENFGENFDEYFMQIRSAVFAESC